MKTIGFAGIVLLLATSWLACKKSKDNPPVSNLNLEKFTDKEWRSHTAEIPWFILRFNSDSTGYQKNLKDRSGPTYLTYNFKWSRFLNDSIKISYETYWPITMRVYSVSDNILVINNWMYGGVTDTTKFSLYAN
jgi:hypothetical protein